MFAVFSAQSNRKREENESVRFCTIILIARYSFQCVFVFIGIVHDSGVYACMF